MDFGKQIKQMRLERKLTQEQLANHLGVSRQAVSNWENNKNLPDLELILGGNTMNNLTEKLIKDGSETRRAKMNLISIAIGGIFLCFGISCIFLKAVSVEYIDTQGILHENFFLLPVGFLCLFCGFITFLTIGIRNIFCRIKKKFRS